MPPVKKERLSRSKEISRDIIVRANTELVASSPDGYGDSTVHCEQFPKSNCIIVYTKLVNNEYDRLVINLVFDKIINVSQLSPYEFLIMFEKDDVIQLREEKYTKNSIEFEYDKHEKTLKIDNMFKFTVDDIVIDVFSHRGKFVILRSNNGKKSIEIHQCSLFLES